MSRRCNANQPHAEHVARLALDLFRGLRPLHGLANADGELLEFAALLHDIGFHVAPSRHHKHSAYLIENADLQGFTADEIQVLAQTVRYHRKATPKDSHPGYAALPAAGKQKVRGLAAMLRLADGLDRGYAQLVRGVRCRIGDKSVEVDAVGLVGRRARAVGRAPQARPRGRGVRSQIQVYGGARVDNFRRGAHHT